MSANGSGDLRAARIDLAAAFRWAARCELNEAVDNHLSFAPTDRDGAFLINAYGMHWSEIGPDDLLLVDTQGTVLEGEGFVEPSALSIHGGIHRRNTGPRAAMHTHMPYATALTLLEDGRLETAAHQNSLRFHGAVAYDPVFAGLADPLEEGERIADALGTARVLFLAHHGVIVVGKTIAGCFYDLYLLERACRLQVLAMSTGQPLAAVSENAAQATAADWERNVELYAGKNFAALKRLLALEDPIFAE